MFSFLNPFALWALPIAAAPLIIHLVLLRRAQRLPFGDLTLLREAFRRSLPSSRLRQWLLLAARCLALAALVLAFARPVLHPASGGAAAADEGAAVVFLADVSYSMALDVRGRSRLRWAQEAGLAMLEKLSARDRVAVAGFSDRLEGEGLDWAGDRAAARAALERLKPGTGTTDFPAALAAAYKFLKPAKAGKRVIVLLTDGAAHGFKGAPPKVAVESLPGFDPQTLLVGLSWDADAGNAAVASLSAEPAAAQSASALGRARASLAFGQERIEARLWLSGEARPGWDASLWQGEAREDVRHVNLEPGLGAAVSFALRSNGGSGT
ncbi:MAG: VWA domain-containing protein, partial [Elusimicrobia bacterium]|nr:VWA domain-containing protein [Elusimicrobiota bacterium]